MEPPEAVAAEVDVPAAPASLDFAGFERVVRELFGEDG